MLSTRDASSRFTNGNSWTSDQQNKLSCQWRLFPMAKQAQRRGGVPIAGPSFFFHPPHSRALSRTRTHCVRGYMGEREKEVRNTYVLRQGVKEERSSNSMFSGVLATLLSLLSPQLLSPHVSPSFPQSGLLSPIYDRLIGSLLSPSMLVSPGSRYCDPVRPLVRTDSISMSPCCDKVSTRA